jgi:exopolyphosphatase / guanosine-5'-triphosphate,3'-diphosphate pyrophosphatase
VATLKDQFIDVDDDAARFALMSWFFEENLRASALRADEQARAGVPDHRDQRHGDDGGGVHLNLKRYDRTRWTGCR